MQLAKTVSWPWTAPGRSALTRPLTKAISGVLFSGFIPSRDGFDFGFLIRRLIHSRRRSYYLFFNYLSYYLYVLPVWYENRGGVLPVWYKTTLLGLPVWY